MTALDILYLGPLGGTCLDRARALGRLGHRVLHLDPRTMLPASPWVDRITWRVGGEIFSPLVMKGLRRAVGTKRFDLCLVDSGEWISPSVLSALRGISDKVMNYNIDDPFGPRDGNRFTAYRKSVRYYDAVVVVRDENIDEARRRGAKRVQRVWMSADEISHAPRLLTAADHQAWDSEVLFLGTWMPERGPFMLELINRGVPLTIRGDNWKKAPEWQRLKAFWKSTALSGDDYAKAIQCAKINIGLLSSGNRDRHTTRSLEIPSLGGLLCAQRTDEHLAMYRESKEAVFWSNATECALHCMNLLHKAQLVTEISAAGRRRFMRDDHHNQKVMQKILDEI